MKTIKTHSNQKACCWVQPLGDASVALLLKISIEPERLQLGKEGGALCVEVGRRDRGKSKWNVPCLR
jgi:hypothetical protein